MQSEENIFINNHHQNKQSHQYSLGLRMELVSSKLYLLEEEFQGRFRQINEIQDSYLRSYEISRDRVTEQRVAVRSYSALEPNQQSAVIQNMESFLKLSQIEGMCKLIAFTKKVESGIISAAFEYNDRSLQQILQEKDYFQIRTSLYSLILRQSFGIIRNLEMIGITIEQIIPTFMLLQQIGGELRMKLLFDEREKKYDEILQGAVSFASPEKILAVINRTEEYQSVECQQAIFELGLLLLEFLYQFETFSLKERKQSSQQFSKDAPLPRPHTAQQSYITISKEGKVYLNNSLINFKISFLKQLNNHIVSIYLELIIKMIQPLQKRISFEECCTEVEKLQSIIAQTIRDDLAIQSKNDYYLQLFQTPQKHLPIEKQPKFTQDKRQNIQQRPTNRNTAETALKNAISQTTLASPQYTSTLGDALKLTDPVSQQKMITINIPKQKLLFQARNNSIIRPKFNDFIDRLQQKNIVKKQYYDGSVYYGELGLNKKRQGFGVYISNSGDIYFGSWLQNALSDGNYLFKNGESFEGTVKNGKQGWGRYFYLNGNVYEGEWRDDVKNGLGKMQYPNGDSYQGAWSRGKKNGQGKYKYATGAIYDGNFLDGKKSGFGVITFPSGTKVEAHWNRTHIEGPGRVFYNNGDYFQGNYQLSQKQGIGFYKWQDSQYEGQFKKDLMQGQACVRFSEQQSYQGRIRNGKRDGRGIYRYSNGDLFEGQWKNDQKILGLYKFYEGVTFQGRFKQNAISYGLMIYQNGQNYEGQFHKGERSGIGIYRNTNRQTLYEGKWQHDQFLGPL